MHTHAVVSANEKGTLAVDVHNLELLLALERIQSPAHRTHLGLSWLIVLEHHLLWCMGII